MRTGPHDSVLVAEDQRKLWLDTATSIFKMIYKDHPADLPIGDLLQKYSPFRWLIPGL